MSNIANNQKPTLLPVLPYPLNLDPDDQPYREGHFVSREVAVFDPSLGLEFGVISRVSVGRHSSDPVGRLTEQYAVLWNSGEITEGHVRASLKSQQWTAAEINAAEKEVEGFQANIAWE